MTRRTAGPPMIMKMAGRINTIIGTVSNTGVRLACSSSYNSPSLRNWAAATRNACASGVP